MPLFVYRCPQGHEFEKLIRSGEPRPAIVCETCYSPESEGPIVTAELVPAAVSPFQWGKGGSWH